MTDELPRRRKHGRDGIAAQVKAVDDARPIDIRREIEGSAAHLDIPAGALEVVQFGGEVALLLEVIYPVAPGEGWGDSVLS